jgi:photosystem II stability/assembly factor-like uncharacterized protein
LRCPGHGGNNSHTNQYVKKPTDAIPTRTITSAATPTLPPTPTATPTQAAIPDYMWAAIGPYGGKICALVVSPSESGTLYAAGGLDRNQVYTITDGGESWALSNRGLGEEIIFWLIGDPAESTTVYARTLWGILKSTDGGINWSTANRGFSDLKIFDVAVDPSAPNTLYAGAGDGVYKSTNGGMQWKRVNSGLAATSITALAVDPIPPYSLYAGMHEGGV